MLQRLIRRWRSPPWLVFITLGYGAAVLLLQHLDPFGLTAASERQSAAAYLGVVAPFYRSHAQQDITVVLIDDDFLDRVGDGWPLPYRRQGDLLRRILSFEPRAVFIDLLYERYHGAAAAAADRAQDFSDALGGYLNDVGPTGIPVMLAKSAYASLDDPSPSGCDPVWRVERSSNGADLLPEFDNPGFQRAYVGWRGCETFYPLWLASHTDLPTPAFALYRDVYCRSSNLSVAQREHCEIARDGERARANFAAPMVVRWGSVPSRVHAGLFAAGGQNCQHSDASIFGRAQLAFDHLIASFAQSPSSSVARGRRLPCPYIDTISASWLLGAHAEQVQALLKGRIVLIGAHIAGVGDIVQSPVNGQLPGVVWHAMALDNLITSGHGYLREMSAWSVGTIEAALLMAFLGAWLLSRRGELTEAKRSSDIAPRFSIMAILSLVLWLGLGLSLLLRREFYIALTMLVLGPAFDLTQPYLGFKTVLLSAAALLANIVLMMLCSFAPMNWIAIVGGVLAASALSGSSHSSQRLHPASLLWLCRSRCRSGLKNKSR